MAGLLKVLQRFEDTGAVGDLERSGQPCLRNARPPFVPAEMEGLASELEAEISSAREVARRIGLPPSLVRNILHRILDLYPYRLQSCHESSQADTLQREAFARWAFSKIGENSNNFF